MRKINKIIVHHTAVDTTIDNLRASVQRRGYADIPYHYVITPDGTIHETRPVTRMGAHCKGHNADSIGVALMGNLDRTPPTEAQVAALTRLLANLRKRYAVPICAHRELAHTACPGRYLIPVLDAIRYNATQVTKHG